MRGGTAGGGKGGPQLSYVKKQPKFLEQFRMKANGQNDEHITNQMLEMEQKSKQEEMEEQLKRQGYDIENAQVEYVNYDNQKKEEIVKKEKNQHQNQQQKESSKIGTVEHVDLKTFKPVFKKKNTNEKDDKAKESNKQEKKESKKETKNDSQKRKSKLDDYVKEYDIQEKKATKKKKVKQNLISFGDEEDEEN